MTDTPPTPATSTTASATPSAVTTATTVKSGYRTTEFWLTFAAQVVGGLLAADVLAPGSTPAKIAGIGMMVLTALGYTYSRTVAKAAV